MGLLSKLFGGEPEVYEVGDHRATKFNYTPHSMTDPLYPGYSLTKTGYQCMDCEKSAKTRARLKRTECYEVLNE